MNNNVLYLEVYKAILHSINLSEYSENTPLPSERFLTEKYNVSRSTIRLALQKLKADGYIYTVHGKGSYVKPRVFIQPLDDFYTFTDGLKSNNALIKNNIIEYSLISLEESLATKLGYECGSYFHKLKRLRLEKSYPLMIETTYLPVSVFPKLDLVYLEGHGSLYTYLSETYHFIGENATETFRPIIAQEEERELLHIPSNIPCLLLERFTYQDHSIIEYTESIIRGDKFIFKVNL